MLILNESLELTKTLARNYLFRGLPEPVIKAIAGLVIEREFGPEDVIVKRFGKGTNLFVILEGAASIKGSDGEDVAQFGPGSVIGEISLVDQQTRSATVVATSEVRAAMIPIDALRGMIEMDPSVGLTMMTNIAQLLCKRLRHMNEHVDSLGLKK